MGSVSRIFSVPGGQFDAGVVHAGDVAEQPGNKKLKLPGGSRVGMLAELPVAKDPADREKLKILMSKTYALEEETLQYVEARFAEQRADREAEHERAKHAVVEQGNVLEGLKKTLIEDSQEWIRADNARRLAGNAVGVAERELASQSRFASRKEVEAAEKRVELATKKYQTARDQGGRIGPALELF
jgi:hypothetical protein